MVELASDLWKRGGNGWMLDSVRELAEGVLEEGAMAARFADGYFSLEQEVAAGKRVRLATVTNGILLQVIPIQQYLS
jgi:hypothetical protein